MYLIQQQWNDEQSVHHACTSNRAEGSLIEYVRGCVGIRAATRFRIVLAGGYNVC